MEQEVFLYSIKLDSYGFPKGRVSWNFLMEMKEVRMSVVAIKESGSSHSDPTTAVKDREPTLVVALLPMIFLILILSVGILKYKVDPQIPLVIAAIFSAAIGFYLKYSWAEMEEGIIATLTPAMQAILIQMIIGIVIGTWILAGVVPTMIYYGMKILSPSIFLPSAAVICSIVSVATGSAWTTMGTVGIALLGVGQGLGIGMPMVAGAIISGAYFGDKMSPLSDSTNLAPAVTGANLFEHISHMLKTTGVSFVIAIVLYAILGMKYGNDSLDIESINTLLASLQANFYISPVLLLPPVLVVLIVIFKIPAVPGLLSGGVLGAIFAVIFQGADLGTIMKISHYGFTMNSGYEALDNLLTRGGLDSMMYTVSLIIVAMSFGGIIEKIGVLRVILKHMMGLVTSTGSLVLTTAVSCIFCNIAMADQYLAIVIPGRMYKQKFVERGLHIKNLSRVLEDAGTLTSPLVPWSTCGAFIIMTLGISPFAFLPFAFLNLINPVVSVIYAYFNITMDKAEEAECGC